ncbi:MAG: hypothetical protein DSY57_06840 [Desulfobulbus sp.]|nr:MAG: hypothetical protein DSY57_06840 [Desulfobulbus sp.]
MKLSYTYWFFFLLTCFFIGCAPQNRVNDDQKIPSSTRIQSYTGTIIAKSNRKQTITLKVAGDTSDREKIIKFDHQTRGMEYSVRGKQVKITCKSDNNKTCKAVTIKPGATIYATGVMPVTVHELKKKIDAHRDFVLIDTRSPAEYSRSHLPSALSFEVCGADITSLPQSIDRDAMLIFYCGWPDCHRGIAAAKKAAQNGFSETYILQGGLEAWVDKNYPLIASDDFISKGNLVLLDLRSADRDKIRRIEGSVSLPLEQLADRIKDIPHGAPILVYGNHLGDSLSALKILRSAGFSRAAMVEGNFPGWIRRGNRVVSGPIQTAITWAPPRQQGEISASRFMAAEHNTIRAVILDVRTDKELSSLGRLTNSVHIPLASLERRMGELDKKQMIYCAAGPRAELAGRILRKKGYNAFFLANDLQCDGKKCWPKKEP